MGIDTIIDEKRSVHAAQGGGQQQQNTVVNQQTQQTQQATPTPTRTRPTLTLPRVPSNQDSLMFWLRVAQTVLLFLIWVKL